MILKVILLRLHTFARKQYGRQVNMSKISKKNSNASEAEFMTKKLKS